MLQVTCGTLNRCHVPKARILRTISSPHIGYFGTTHPWRNVLPDELIRNKSKETQRNVQLRDYQEECVQAVLQAFREGRRRVGASLATGAGKTVIFTELIDRLHPNGDATQTLILVHRRELVEQAARQCSLRYPEKRIEIEMGNLHASGSAEITVASIQSIISKDRVDKFDPTRFKLVLVDEAHHIVASSYLHVLNHFGLQSGSEADVSKPALVGVSATFSRFDGLALGKAIKHIVYHKDYVDMIGEKWLSDVIFTTVKSKADISKVRASPTGDFATSSLSKAVNNEESNLITVRAWMTRAKDRKSTLVFCVDLDHVKGLEAMFRAHGIDAKSVSGYTDNFKRGVRIQGFRNQQYPVLINCGVFTEGTDVPNIDCIILARPTKSRNLLVQMIGRGMRLSPGKINCHVIDMVASLKGGIVTTPSLFGLDPSELVEEAGIDRMKTRNQESGKEKAKQTEMVTTNPNLLDISTSGQIKFTDYESVTDLVSDTSGERHIRALSPLAWVLIGNYKYVLADGSNSYLVIEKPEGSKALFTVRLIPVRQLGSPEDRAVRYLKPRLISEAETLESAVHAADTYADHQFVRALVSLGAPWRKREASQAQVEFLNIFRGKEGTEPLSPTSITKGEANDMITKLKHGAKGFMKQVSQLKQRENKKAEKEQKLDRLRHREHVTVGPLAAV